MAEASGLMRGKRGLIMGVANNRSIAWGIARACREPGAELAFTYQGDALKKRVEPLAAGNRRASSSAIATSPTRRPSTRCSPTVQKAWGTLDFVVHAIAFSDKDELDGRYVDTTAGQFHQDDADLLLFVHRGRAARREADAATAARC